MNISQFNFSAGEISPQVENKIDTNIPNIGLAKCENVVVTTQGTLVRRPGTMFLRTTTATFLTPYEYQGTNYILAWTPGGTVELMDNNGAPLSPAKTTANPYTDAQLKILSIAQAQDILYLACKGMQLRKLTYDGTTLAISTVALTGTATDRQGTAIYDAWKQDNAARYPSAVCLWRNRLFLSGQTSRPSALGASDLGAFEQMTDRTKIPNTGTTTIYEMTEQNALDRYLGGGIGRTQWMIGQKVLYQGTEMAEVVFQESAEGRLNPDVYTRPLAKYDAHGQVGSTSTIALAHAEGPIHVNGDQVRIITYSTERQVFNSLPLSDYSTVKGPFRQGAISSIPHTIVWLVADDGTLYGLTYEPKNEIAAWHRHVTYNADGTQAKFKSIAVLRVLNEQRVFLVVERNGSHFLEQMRQFAHEDQVESAHMDCAVRGVGSVNAGHLSAWDEVGCMVAGAEYQSQVPGTITVAPGEVIFAGIPFDSTVITTPRRMMLNEQYIQTKKLKTTKVNLVLHKSMGIKVGTDEAKLDLALGRLWTNDLGQAPPWFTGEIERTIEAPPGASRVVIKSSTSLPFEVLGIITEVQVSGGQNG